MLGAWAEKKLGEAVGVSPGSEMLHAIKLAKKHQLRIAFIDQDIEITLRRLSAELTWREKWNFLVDLCKGIFSGKKQMKELREDALLSLLPEFLARFEGFETIVFGLIQSAVLFAIYRAILRRERAQHAKHERHQKETAGQEA